MCDTSLQSINSPSKPMYSFLFCFVKHNLIIYSLKKNNNPKPVTETPENFCIYINFMKQLKTNIEKKVLNSKIVMNLCKVLNSMIIMSVFQCL